MALFWRNLLKTVCFCQNGCISAKDTQNSGFGHNRFFWQKMLTAVVLAKMAFFGKSSLRQ